MTATASNPIKVFYSYVSQDKILRERLDAHLSALERQGKITTWYDGLIEPGMVKDQVRGDRLKTADLILLLISPEFISSDKHWEEEVLQALERQKSGKARVIPIILRPTDWQHTPIGVLEPLPTDGKPITAWTNRDKAFKNVADGIRKVVETLIAEKKEVERISERVTERIDNLVSNQPSRNLPKGRLLQLVISVLLLVVILLASVIFILVRVATDNSHTIFIANASATARANAHATASAATRATASVINATPHFNAVDATFYTNPKDSGKVDFNTATQGLFSLSFPNISFNPSPGMQHCNPPTTVNVDTRPFTDVVQNADGSCKTIQVKDSSGNQAGVGNLNSFEAKIIAVIDLPSAGRLTINISADDGWIFCLENKSFRGPKPTPDPHNIRANPPTSHLCPGLGLPEMADNNVASSPRPFTIPIIMNIPAAGSFGVELDYTECCSLHLTLVVSPFS